MAEKDSKVLEAIYIHISNIPGGRLSVNTSGFNDLAVDLQNEALYPNRISGFTKSREGLNIAGTFING